MQILLCMRNQVHRSKKNSVFILNLFALQFISLIALSRLDQSYRKIAEVILIFVNGQIGNSTLLVYVHFSFNIFLITIFMITMLLKNFKHRQFIKRCIGIIILNFKYVFLIPVGCVNVKPLINPQVQIKLKVFCAFNMFVTLIMSAAELYTNWSNRFIEKDYCNRRQNSILCLIFQFSFVFSSIAFGSLVGSLFLIAVSIFRAYQVSITVQYPLIQKSTFFYCSLNIYICIICLVGNSKLQFFDFTFKIIIGIMMSSYFAENACNFINTWYGNNKNLYKLNMMGCIKKQKENMADKADNMLKLQKVRGSVQKQIVERQTQQIQSQSKTSISYKDIIILSRILLSRESIKKVQLNEKVMSKGSGNGNQQIFREKLQNHVHLCNQWRNIWWQKYDILLFCHMISCMNDKCKCKASSNVQTLEQSGSFLRQVDDSQIFKQDMKKLMERLQQKLKTVDIHIMSIYLGIQIINKPLKAYYEIIKIFKQEVSLTNSVDLQCLLIETRQSFNRIFLQKNIQNNSLPLLKITKFENLTQNLEGEIKNIIQLLINFNELFTLNSIKVNQLLNDSKKIQNLKQGINSKIYDLVLNYPDSIYINFLIFIFYQYIEVYCSKQKQLKTISQQKNIKKRLFQKQDHNIFSLQYGVIYIDLVEDKGKIKRITKNICQIYGYSYEDMVDFNINQFMPRIFSKNHHKFLMNFIEHGKVKILGSKKRILMGKNKNKFIFPLEARLKLQYLFSSQFGSSALIKKQQTSSQFIIFNSNGKVEQISQYLYRMVFSHLLKSQVDKIRRLSLLKMIPSLVNLINDGLIDQNSQKIHESLFIFTQFSDMLEKFRIYRESKNGYTSTYNSSSTSYYSSKLDLEQTTNQLMCNTNGLGSTYYAELFKSFLNDINIIKLNAHAINYKVYKIKTEEFSIFMLQILSIQVVEDPFVALILQYKNIAQYLNVYEEHGSISQNLVKYHQIVSKNNVLDFMLNKNIQNRQNIGLNKLNCKQALKSYKKSAEKDKNHRKKMLTIGEGQVSNQNNRPQSIQSNSVINNFQDLANGVNNPQIIRGGSERSSITDHSQNQSKKQMLINAFNSNNNSVNVFCLVLINVIAIALFSILIVLISKSILQIQQMHKLQLKNIMNLKINGIFQYRFASQQIQKFYHALQVNGSIQVPINPKNQLKNTKKALNQQFTQTLLMIKQLSSLISTDTNINYLDKISIWDIYLERNKDITILQLLNDLNYKFRSNDLQPLDNNVTKFLQINYERIHQKFKILIENIKTKSTNDVQSEGISKEQAIILVFGSYELICIILVLLWVPIIYYVAKEEKKIISLLGKMNIKQLKKTTNKYKFIFENLRLSKNIVSHINFMISMLNDQKMDQNFDHLGNQKNITKSIKLVQQPGCYSIKPRSITLMALIFLIFFSILPLTFYLNLNIDSSNFKSMMKVVEETYFLSYKAPFLVNLYLTNINKIYSSQQTKKFNSNLYQQAQQKYFNLNLYISGAQQLSNDLISPSGTNHRFTSNICEQLQNICSQSQKLKDIKFYDQISLIRETFSIFNPNRLNVQKINNTTYLQKWIQQNDIVQTLNWINKLYLFSKIWGNNFQKMIQKVFTQTQKRFYILGGTLIPAYIIIIIYIEIWLVRKLNTILKNAENIHMHFPVQILAENTYLTSYFNDKIKNNK